MDNNNLLKETFLDADIRDTNEKKCKFSVRIVVCDYYLTKPIPGIDVIYSDFRGSDIKQVPVLRIFGPTRDGHKACLHIHGVFPYFYLPCPTPNPEPQFLYQIASSLDKALNIALKQASSANQHVYKISLVKGLPFYGFHDKEHLFLKVFLYNPGLVKQAVELCSNGAISGQTLQPFESHLNFTLQFFIDFNLFGMSYIDIQTLVFRKSEISQESNEPFSSPDGLNLKPESMCFYEADCIAAHIINRQRVGKGDGIENPGLEEVWNQEIERRKQLNMSISSKSLSQGGINFQETESHNKFQHIFNIKMSQLIDKPVLVEDNASISKESVHYPAETQDGSQLFNATDVSSHINETMLNLSINNSLKPCNNLGNYNSCELTVNEDIALNSSLSLHYSQVFLDSEDLELVDILQGLEDKPIEEGSIMGTQAHDSEEEMDDAEYSKIFDDETILIDRQTVEGDNRSKATEWDDSFWEGASIPQLDGTFDDDHVKKVRKRKMIPFKIGLSRPKNNRSLNVPVEDKDTSSNAETDETEVINASRDTIEDISVSYIKKCSDNESQSILNNFKNICEEKSNNEVSVTSIVNNMNAQNVKIKHINKVNIQDEPLPGPSHVVHTFPKETVHGAFFSDSDCSTSSEDAKLGIKSVYDNSKFFNLTLEDSTLENLEHNISEIKELSTNVDIEIVKKEQVTILPPDHPIDTIKILAPKIRPPKKDYILSTLEKYSIPKKKNPEPYFSNPNDVGDKVEIGCMILKVSSKLAQDQKPFDKMPNVTSIEEWRHLLFLQNNDIVDDSTKSNDLKLLLAGNQKCVLKPLRRAPIKSDVYSWLKNINNFNNEENKNEMRILEDTDGSQAIGLNETDINSSISLETDEKNKTNLDNTLQVTMQPDGSYLCFNSESQKDNSICSPVVEVDFLTIMLLEVHTSTRGELNPDPAIDAIQAIFLTITNDSSPAQVLPRHQSEIFVSNSNEECKYLDRCIFNSKITYVNDENDFFDKLVAFVRRHDPDILCGYEIEMNSWGYVLERAQTLGVDIVKELSRITDKNRQKRWRNEDNEMEGRILGRITFNAWRLFPYELALSSYSFENCMYEILKERVPKYSFAQLSKWWNNESRMFRWIPVEYYLTRLSGTVRMLEKLDIINRTSELARLFGLQWWEVISRGSQFRVESLMLRAARPLNLVALSPTVKQRAAMRAPECLPLILEPESRFYTDPIIVLDFQSLYPSMMIAYNYCFSTCIGRAQNINGETPYEFGAWKLRIPKAKLEALSQNNRIHWSPVGVGFVKSSVRRGVLPALLRRILAARQAVKRGMKMQTDETIKKAMHSRQLGLKLIANVTYGYTAANFSGRMPCVEVGDSVVAKGRETLERAIKLVSTSGRWNVKVVYGDTDSLFVLVPGGSRAEAFEVGRQIAQAVSADNPSPVALKLEKVYQPCILQTKKRYVGFMYESAEQESPVFEAKGIETVRRDGCPAGVKLLQSSLYELFSSGDVSRVKRLVCEALEGLETVSPLDLMFTREYHGPNGYRPSAVAPPKEIAKRAAQRDARSVPRAGWRVRWAVAGGAGGEPLVRLARAPEELLRQRGLTPHVPYYAARVLLPPLHRCLSLLGLDVFKWWRELGRGREAHVERATSGGGIARFLRRGRCALCGTRAARSLCAACAAPTPSGAPSDAPSGAPAAAAATALAARAARQRSHAAACAQICASCCGHRGYVHCQNTECPVIWRRMSAQQKLEQLQDIVDNLPNQYNGENFNF